MTPRPLKPPKTQSRSAKSTSTTSNFRIAERHDLISKLEGGGHPHVVAVARRLLTEMEQALASMEEHYAASQERLAQLLSASPAVIYSFKATADFAPTFVSDNITSVFGYPRRVPSRSVVLARQGPPQRFGRRREARDLPPKAARSSVHLTPG
jgi:PAS domain-containing protein